MCLGFSTFLFWLLDRSSMASKQPSKTTPGSQASLPIPVIILSPPPPLPSSPLMYNEHLLHPRQCSSKLSCTHLLSPHKHLRGGCSHDPYSAGDQTGGLRPPDPSGVEPGHKSWRPGCRLYPGNPGSCPYWVCSECCCPACSVHGALQTITTSFELL